MGQHIRWQAIIAFTGIAMTLAFLGFLAFSRKTITIIVPEVGGKYIEGVVGTPQFINPLLAQANQVDQDLVALIFNGLTRADGQGNLVPDLAKSWLISEDGLRYDFQLRQDVRWQDGAPFTADDVFFTIALMQNPDFPGDSSLATVWRTVSVQKIDDYTIRFILSEPFLGFMNFTTLGILPSHLFKDVVVSQLLYHPFNLHPIGTGIFKLNTVNAEFARLSPNPFYNGTKPKLTMLEFRFYPNYDEILTAYQAGQVLGLNIPPESISTTQTLESLNLYHARLPNMVMIYLNLRDETTVPFFQEVEVRQALLQSLNRSALIDQALHGEGLLATGPILAWSWAYNPNQPITNFDPEKATRLLTRIGWADHNGDGVLEREGRALAFTLLTSNEPTKIEVARLVSQQWQQLGISVTVEIVATGLSERLSQHTFQAALVEVTLGEDPDPYPMWHSTQFEGGQNYGGWNNRRASVLLEKARGLTNQGGRNDFYFAFQRIFADEVPALVLYYPIYTYGVNQKVLDVQLAPLLNPSDRFRSIANWYIITSRVIHKEVGIGK